MQNWVDLQICKGHFLQRLTEMGGQGGRLASNGHFLIYKERLHSRKKTSPSKLQVLIVSKTQDVPYSSVHLDLGFVSAGVGVDRGWRRGADPDYPHVTTSQPHVLLRTSASQVFTTSHILLNILLPHQLVNSRGLQHLTCSSPSLSSNITSA